MARLFLRVEHLEALIALNAAGDKGLYEGDIDPNYRYAARYLAQHDLATAEGDHYTITAKGERALAAGRKPPTRRQPTAQLSKKEVIVLAILYAEPEGDVFEMVEDVCGEATSSILHKLQELGLCQDDGRFGWVVTDKGFRRLQELGGYFGRLIEPHSPH